MTLVDRNIGCIVTVKAAAGKRPGNAGLEHGNPTYRDAKELMIPSQITSFYPTPTKKIAGQQANNWCIDI